MSARAGSVGELPVGWDSGDSSRSWGCFVPGRRAVAFASGAPDCGCCRNVSAPSASAGMALWGGVFVLITCGSWKQVAYHWRKALGAGQTRQTQCRRGVSLTPNQ